MFLDTLKDDKLFTPAEAEIVRFILKDPEEVIDMTVNELAAATFSSPSSIIRICKKVGLKGFPDFKVKLAVELNSMTLGGGKIEPDIPILPDSSDREIAKTMLNLQYQALTDIYHAIDLKAVRKAAEMIDAADVVSLYGRGESLILAEELHYKLVRIGLTSYLETLNGFQLVRDKKKVKKEVAVIISHYVDSKQIRSIFYELKGFKVPIILICGRNDIMMAKLADVAISINNFETHRKMGSFASRTAMQYIIDCIYCTLFSLHYKENVEFLRVYAAHVAARKKFVDDIG